MATLQNRARESAASEGCDFAPIDAHCHLHHPAFDSDRDSVLARAREGLAGVVVSACSPEEVEPVLALRRAHPGFVHAALGLHPSALLRTTGAAIQDYMDRLRDLRGQMVAVGEFGFDYKWVREPAQQKRMGEVADRFLDLAKELRLPAVLHMRNAPEEDYRRVLDSGVPCQFHCWTASRSLALEAASRGHLVSIAPNVAKFKNPKRAAESAPLESLVVETDAPFFGLGERTEPGDVAGVCRAVAEFRGEDPARVARATAENAVRFFRFFE
ncbi:MAG: TatD family hydrolase [Halobacteria archaeon]